MRSKTKFALKIYKNAKTYYGVWWSYIFSDTEILDSFASSKKLCQIVFLKPSPFFCNFHSRLLSVH